MTPPRTRFPQRTGALRLALLLGALCGGVAQSATPTEMLSGYSTATGAPAVAARGQAFFTTKHGREWSCASCHGAMPLQAGRHAGTGKAIEALAPTANPKRFTDAATTEKWFRRNCNDVLGRECSASEKADVLAWLQSLRP